MSADEPKSLPKSMRHRRVLDIAAENPDASLDELASKVPSATVDLVERVLDEHGDPVDEGTADSESASEDDASAGRGVPNGAASAAQPDADEPGGTTDEPSSVATSADGDDTPAVPDGAPAPEDDAESGADLVPTTNDLTAKQREVLAAVGAHPDATQREIGRLLGVSSATVSNWANSVSGFDWNERASFVDAVFEGSPPTPASDGGTSEGEPSTDDRAATARGSDSERVPDDVRTAVERLEARIDELESDSGSADCALGDPELVHKVVHACMESDAITEEEELRILRDLL